MAYRQAFVDKKLLAPQKQCYTSAFLWHPLQSTKENTYMSVPVLSNVRRIVFKFNTRHIH